jgi:phage N-6-adenine-methyltransferase
MDELKQSIEINPEFKDLIFPLTTEEYQGLEESIIEEGCRDAITLWNSTILDGHNRYEICQKHNIEFKIQQKDFENIFDAKIWILKNQTSRRNLSPYQRSVIVLKGKEIIKAKAKENERINGRNRKKSLTTLPNSPIIPINTRKELAKEAKVSEGTLNKVQKIQEKASDEMKKQLSSGEISINEAYKKVNVHVGQNSGENEWYTPKYIIDAARNTMGSIDLDPASNELADKIVQATKYYTKETDGLDKTWNGNVWMNPPYDKNLMPKFSQKFVSELSNIDQGCVLVNNATDTQWMQNIMDVCDAICFLRSRVKFIDMDGKATGSPLQGQAVMYFGKNIKKFYDNFNSLGICMTRINPEIIK